MVAAGEERWVEVSPSQFTHEAEGLAIVRALMPDETPFRAWSNFEFRDSRGRWHEVDLLLLGRGCLHLVELKHYYGVISGNDRVWVRDGKRPEDSPLLLARRKAQYFASKLKDELRLWAQQAGTAVGDERKVVPFVQESVFLHHVATRVALPEAGRARLFGLPGHEDRSGLPSIVDLIQEPPGRLAIGENQERILTALMARIGLVQRRDREAGSWVIEHQAIDSGDGWQDWLAYHKFVHEDRGRIRFQVLPSDAAESSRDTVRQLAEHEYKVMHRLHHDGLLAPRDYVESELGVGLVYPYDPSWERLDLWYGAQGRGVPLATQLSIIRQVGEALQYAHNNKVVHRALTPKAVWVRPVPGTDHEVKVRVGDWQAAGATDTAAATSTAPAGITMLVGVQTSAGAAPDPESAMTEVFAAPEGAWNAGADRVRLDVFGLGALAFYLLSAGPPADTREALRTRLREQQGLDLAVDLPQVPSTLRSLVLKATHPSPTQRTADVTTVLVQLSQAEREAGDDVASTDPLEATAGTVLDGRFEVRRRLGQGSTAVGLLVDDLQATGTDRTRVLKVALGEEAAARLVDEAQVLGTLSSPRVVRLLEGPVVVGGRSALVLESAGEETLTEALRSRQRLSLDLLERYGKDLLDALVDLDHAGVDHRDIKPSNLGVRTNRGDRTKHLVLFDFSLTRAAASATSAGTPPYLDPFLGGAGRSHFDSAAERYAVAVVLFEMATGATPRYGDGQAAPDVIPDEATVEPGLFDPALAEHLVAFFRTALARDAGRRHHTAVDMRSAWEAIFQTGATTEPDETNDELAEAATLSTVLAQSGLTARALSALEPYGTATVAELLTVDRVRLARMSGVASSTRNEITARIQQWRRRFGDAPAQISDTDVPTPAEAAERLLTAVTSPRTPSRGGLVRLVLGLGTDLDAFATHAQLGAHLPDPVTPARVSQLLDALQQTWAGREPCRALLDLMAGAVETRLGELGSVATPAELGDAVARALRADTDDDPRLLAGLLRLALERRKALARAERSPDAIWMRRRDGAVTVLATDQRLLDISDALGAEADAVIAAAADPAQALVPARSVRTRLATALQDPAGLPDALAEPMRLTRLAAAMSRTAAASGAGELHHRDLSQRSALRHTFDGFSGTQAVTADEIRARVAVRFPTVATLPRRPALDRLVQDAQLGLVYDDRAAGYRGQARGDHTTGLDSRQPTSIGTASAPVGEATAAQVRLETSVRSRSFLALGVAAHRLDRFTELAQQQYGAQVVDLTSVLIDALKRSSASAGMPWETVRAADAAPDGSRPRQGLAELVRRSWPDVVAAVDEAVSAPQPGPVLLTEAAPLARYGTIAMVARWSDLGTSRPRAVWLVSPQLAANHGALLDGQPIPLSAPSQFVALDSEWVDAGWRALQHDHPGATGPESDLAQRHPAAAAAATKES